MTKTCRHYYMPVLAFSTTSAFLLEMRCNRCERTRRPTVTEGRIFDAGLYALPKTPSPVYSC